MSHGGTERTENYKEKQWKSRRHRRCIERRRLFANSISNLYTKRLPQNSYQESVRYTSVALCAIGTSVTSIAFFNNPLSSHFLRVTFRQRTKFGQIFITPNSGRTIFDSNQSLDHNPHDTYRQHKLLTEELYYLSLLCIN